MIRWVTQQEAAEELREQASSCRRLALRAHTPKGATALCRVAEFFELDARRIDPANGSHA